MQPMMSHRQYPTRHRRHGPGRLLWPLLWLLLLIYIIDNPAEAATNARSLIVWLQAGTESIVNFVEQVGATR